MVENTGNDVIGTCEKRKALLFNTYDNSKDYIDLPTITTTLYHNKLLYHYYGVSDGVACYSTIKQLNISNTGTLVDTTNRLISCTSNIIDKVRPKCNNEQCKQYNKQPMTFYRFAKLWKCCLCNSQANVTDEQISVIGNRELTI